MRRALEVPPRRLCLVLDEYELLFEGTDGQPSVPGVGSFLRMARALSMETGRFSLVLIGRDDAWLRGPMLEGFPNPLLGWCADHVVGPLDRPEADELLTTLGARVGLRVGESSRHTAWRWTAGHVLLLRQFGSALLETAHRRGGTPSRRTDALCDEAVDAYLDRSKVRGITGDVLDLLSRRSPPAYALLRDLLASRKTAASFARHGGWHGEGARTLRRLGILLGSSADPFVSETLRIEAPFLPEPPATNQQEGQAA